MVNVERKFSELLERKRSFSLLDRESYKVAKVIDEINRLYKEVFSE